MEDFGGVFPANQKDLLSLKGIGSYTAGAVGSIAFGLPIPAVDGNVLRVMSRITADASDISLQITKKEWESRLAEIMPQECAGDLNQALMELGAMVCLPNGAPKCGVCPCPGELHGIQKSDSSVSRKGGEKAAHIRISERIFLRRWGRNCDWQTPEKWLAFGTLGARRTDRETSAPPVTLQEMGILEAELLPMKGQKAYFYACRMAHGLLFRKGNKKTESDLLWLTREEAEAQYALPSAFKKYGRKG